MEICPHGSVALIKVFGDFRKKTGFNSAQILPLEKLILMSSTENGKFSHEIYDLRISWMTNHFAVGQAFMHFAEVKPIAYNITST